MTIWEISEKADYIADNNGYLIDPYFFDKTVAGATTNFTGGSFYTCLLYTSRCV